MLEGRNRVWSIDGHCTLSRFGFQIYCAMDIYSGYIVWSLVGHSNCTSVLVNRGFAQEDLGGG